MELQNQTRYPVHLFRACIEGPRFAASVLVRVTFDLKGGRLVPSEEQPWIASRTAWKSPHGGMESDDVFSKDGCDVFLFGEARGEGARSVTVRVAVGGFSRSVRVSGDRTWVRRDGTLVPGEPVPFDTMPLTAERAFGGKAEWDGLQVPFADNPVGRGFYLEEDAADGGLLPNVEDPQRPVERWDDRPEPVGLGFCPRAFSSRIRRGSVWDERGRLLEIRGGLYNTAYPAMVAERVEPGQPVRVDGVRAGGPLEFAVPDLPLCVRLRFGDGAHDRRLTIDQLGIDAARDQVFLAYRFAFRYEITEGRPRGATVYEKAAA